MPRKPADPTKAVPAKQGDGTSSGASTPIAGHDGAARPVRVPMLTQWTKLALSSEEEAQLQALALTTALHVLGELEHTSITQRESLRRSGSRLLLKAGAGDSDESWAKLRFAREGLKRLSRTTASEVESTEASGLSDYELASLLRAEGDAFRLAELALRAERSAEAMHVLTMMKALERPAPAVRLAADVGTGIRDPLEGRRVAEMRVGSHDVELFRFEDGALAAYADAEVPLRFVGEQVTPRSARGGYAEAFVGPEGSRIELEIGNARVAIELGIPSSRPPRPS